MNYPCNRSLLQRDAFTLIELLTVISIIAVLAGLLLPVVGKVTDKAKQTTAKAASTQIVTAVNNYQTDYGQYPVNAATNTSYTAGSDYTYGADGHNYLLFQILRATEPTGTTVVNTRRVVYFEGKNVKNTTLPRDGFIATVGATPAKAYGGLSASPNVAFSVGDFVDPWGDCYIIRIDTNYSSAVQNPYKDSVAPATSTDTSPPSQETDVLRFGAVAMSLGIDGKLATNGTAPSAPYTSIGDDVVSWQ